MAWRANFILRRENAAGRVEAFSSDAMAGLFRRDWQSCARLLSGMKMLAGSIAPPACTMSPLDSSVSLLASSVRTFGSANALIGDFSVAARGGAGRGYWAARFAANYRLCS
jgi:hypothetical protein